MNDKGKSGENFATQILAEQGYEIIAMNFASRYGEIDIIAMRGDVICFVEVKTRKKSSIVSAVQSVTFQKQKRIIMTAAVYLSDTSCDLQPRFDIFCVETDGGAISGYQYYEGAFDSGAYDGGF